MFFNQTAKMLKKYCLFNESFKNYVFVIKRSRNESSFERLRNNVVVVIKPLRIETIMKKDPNSQILVKGILSS